MRLSAFLGLSLLLLALSGCGGSSASTSSDTTPPDTTNPPDNGGDPGDGGGDSGGGDNDGDDTGGGDNGGGDDNSPLPPECGYIDEMTAPAVSETLGNTNDPDMYSLAHYHEHTDLNSDLTGTWVMVHRQIKRDQNSQHRATTAIWQKSVFVIRDQGGTLEAGSCYGGGFSELIIEDDRLALPLFGGMTASAIPAFQRISGLNTSLTGIPPSTSGAVSYSDQFTAAIKVSDTITPLGQSSVVIDGSSDNNADIVCLTQKRELTMEQVCTEATQPATLTLSMTLATTNSDPAPLNSQHAITLSQDGTDSYHGISGNGIPLIQINGTHAINVTQADHSTLILSSEIAEGFLCSSWMNCDPENNSLTGSLIFTANLPGAVPAP